MTGGASATADARLPRERGPVAPSEDEQDLFFLPNFSNNLNERSSERSIFLGWRCNSSSRSRFICSSEVFNYAALFKSRDRICVNLFLISARSVWSVPSILKAVLGLCYKQYLLYTLVVSDM